MADETAASSAGDDAAQRAGERVAPPHAVPQGDVDAAFELEPESEVLAPRTRAALPTVAGKTAEIKEGVESAIEHVDVEIDHDADEEEPAPAITSLKDLTNLASPARTAREPLVSPKLVSWRRWAYVGAGLTVFAGYVAFRGAEKNAWAHGLSALYQTVLNAALAIGAGFAISLLEFRPLGSWKELGARALVALATFQIILHTPMPIPGKIEETMLATGAYFGLLMLLMQWPVQRTLRVASAHLVLVVLMMIALALHYFMWRAE
jgi:hypothetical protein